MINWKLILILVFLFMLFTDGAVLGSNVRGFIEWAASGWDALEEFLRTLTGVEEVPTDG